jgi:hypothetical protein
MKKIIFFDLDNVICKTLNNNYKLAKSTKKTADYHNLILGKPAYNYYIEDKAYGYKDNCHVDFCNFKYKSIEV